MSSTIFIFQFVMVTVTSIASAEYWSRISSNASSSSLLLNHGAVSHFLPFLSSSKTNTTTSSLICEAPFEHISTSYYSSTPNTTMTTTATDTTFTSTIDNNNLETNPKFSSYLSLIVLILFFGLIQQTVKPFLNPKGEARVAFTTTTGSTSIYFHISSFLYLWILSSTTLTLLPHFTSHYNVIIASALYFTMFFITFITLLIGRGVIHLLFCHSPLCRRRYRYITHTPSTCGCGIPFYRHFRIIIKTSLLLSTILSLFYAHCWSRTLNAFKIYKDQGSGAMCRIVFFPWIMSLSSWRRVSSSAWITSTQGIHEQAIWILWGISIMTLLLRYAYLEYYEFFRQQRSQDIIINNKKDKDSSSRSSRENSKDSPFMNSSSSSSSASLSSLSLKPRQGTYDKVGEEKKLSMIGNDPTEYGYKTKRNSDVFEQIIPSTTIRNHSRRHHHHHELHPITKSSSKSSLSLFNDEENSHVRRKMDKNNDSFTHKLLKDRLIQKITSWRTKKKTKMDSSLLTSTTYDGPMDTLPMVPWFSLLAAQSVFDLVLQLKVFLGRFDARTIQPALRDFELDTIVYNSKESTQDIHTSLKRRYPGCYFNLSLEKKETNKNQEAPSTKTTDEKGCDFWIDFCADTGDGFNSSYNIARMLAQKSLEVHHDADGKVLPRGNILIIGGDLAYPDPNEERCVWH